MNTDQQQPPTSESESVTSPPSSAGTGSSDVHPVPDAPQPDAPAGPSWRSLLMFIALIVVITIVAFSPTFGNDWVNWDDDVNFTKNEAYRGLWPLHISWMFRTTHNGPYQPLSWMTYGLDYTIWGLNPFGYHLTSLLLHAAGAAVFFLVARRLLRHVFVVGEGEHSVALSISAGVAALFFAVHPLRVESVAWATERRDVLSGLFFFLAVLTYLRARAPEVGQLRSPSRSLGSTFLLFVVAILSKGTTVILPIVLLVLDVYPLRRLRGGPRGWFRSECREVWIEKIPFLIAAVLAGAMALRGQIQAGALVSFAERDIPARLAVAFYGPAFYLWKTCVPVGLSPLYEWPADFSPIAWPFLLSAVVVVALTVLLVRYRSVWPAGLAAWVVYLIFLIPILLPFQVGKHLAADRYSYLSCTAWALLVGAVVMFFWLRRGRGAAVGVTFVAGVVIVALAGLTLQQTKVWRNTWELWSHVLELNPKCWHAYGGLGSDLRDRKQYDRALELLNKGLEIEPNSPELQNNIGSVYSDLGRHAEALPYYRRAIALNERLIAPHYNLGVALLHVDRIDEAIESLLIAVNMQPAFGQAHYRLGQAYLQLAKREESAPGSKDIRKYYELARFHLVEAYKSTREDQLRETLRQLDNKLQLLP